ncbi:MAG: ABC transporter permease subunit [Oscillospiraceae bacterium]|nr:ABC transporter permease subunit [Oscillospiraceae bacterium]
MNIFYDLVRFEFKKSVFRKSSAIAIIIGLIVSALSVYGTILGNSYDRDGNVVCSKYDEMVTDRSYARKLSGREIDADLIEEARTAYASVPQTDSQTYYTDTKEYQEKARQYSEIFNIVRNVTSPHMSMEEFQKLTPQTAGHIYEMRSELQSQLLNDTSMSENAKSFVLKKDSEITTPFKYDYTDGYRRFMVIMYSTAMISAAVCAIILAPVFSGEFGANTAPIILSTKHGKGKLIRAKLTVVFLITVSFTLLLMLINYAECMLMWGRDGASSPIQLMYMLIPYNMTYLSAAAIYCLSILCACIMSSALTALLSSKLRSSFAVIVIISLTLIVPMFIHVSENNILLYDLLQLLPSNMMNIWAVVSSNQYEIAGLVIPPYIFMPAFAIMISALTIPFSYAGFSRQKIS